jgi:uncharacterized protein YjeT (DUF2065 family)
VTSAQPIEVFAVVNFVVIGLSHVLQPKVWVELFVAMRSLGRAGVFLNGMLSLLVGSIIVSFATDWHGAAALLPLIGWAQVVKGVVSLTRPEAGMRGLMRVSMQRAWEIQAAGGVLLLISAAIAWAALSR